MSQVSVERPRGTKEELVPGADASAGNDEPPPSRPSKDAIFEILRASRRREVLRYLDGQGGEASIGDLSEHIAAIENDVDQRAITSSQRKRVYVGLYQSHLPKMANYGVVEWEKDRGVVRLHEPSCWFLAHLYFDPTAESPDEEAGAVASLLERLRSLVRR